MSRHCKFARRAWANSVLNRAKAGDQAITTTTINVALQLTGDLCGRVMAELEGETQQDRQPAEARQ